jgi:MFS family permease
MVTQVLIVAVQNSVAGRELGIATATTGFFRALGGAVGAAVLGAVFAAQAGNHASDGVMHGLSAALRSHVIDAVQTVFLVAAPLAALGLIVVLFLPETPLRTQTGMGEGSSGAPSSPPPTDPPKRPTVATS